jgi:hypothetical protein
MGFPANLQLLAHDLTPTSTSKRVASSRCSPRGLASRRIDPCLAGPSAFRASVVRFPPRPPAGRHASSATPDRRLASQPICRSARPVCETCQSVRWVRPDQPKRRHCLDDRAERVVVCPDGRCRSDNSNGSPPVGSRPRTRARDASGCNPAGLGAERQPDVEQAGAWNPAYLFVGGSIDRRSGPGQSMPLSSVK